MGKIVNLPMLLNPFNWVIIYLILTFGGMAIHAVQSSARQGNQPAS